MDNRNALGGTLLVRALGLGMLGAVIFFGTHLWSDVSRSREVAACPDKCPGTAVSGTLVGGWEIRDQRAQEWALRDQSGTGPIGAFLPSSAASLAPSRGAEVRAWVDRHPDARPESDNFEILAIESGGEVVRAADLEAATLAWRAATLLGMLLLGVVILTFPIGLAGRLTRWQSWGGFVGLALIAAGLIWQISTGPWFWVPVGLFGVSAVLIPMRGRFPPDSSRRLRFWLGIVVTLACASVLITLGLSERTELQARVDQRICSQDPAVACADTHDAQVGRRVRATSKSNVYYVVYFEVDDTTRYWGIFSPDHARELATGDPVSVAVYRGQAFWATKADGSVQEAAGVQPFVPWIYFGFAGLLALGAGFAVVRRETVQLRNREPSGS